MKTGGEMEIEDGGWKGEERKSAHDEVNQKRERYTQDLSALMIRNGSIRIRQPLEKQQASHDPPTERPLHISEGDREIQGEMSQQSRKGRGTSVGDTRQQCLAPGKSASRRLCALRSQQSLSGPWRQTLTWITETLTLTGNSSETLQNLDEGLNAFVKAILQDNLVLSAVVQGQ